MAQIRRLELHILLKTLLGTDNVYYQPPPSVQMGFPCIVYKRSSVNTDFADNFPYSTKKRYQITVIDKDPDSEIPDKVSALPMCSFDRFFTADGLNHDVFNIFF